MAPILSHFDASGWKFSTFRCFAAMSAVDRGQEISLSDFYFLFLQDTIKGSKVLRAQVAERTEKEEDSNRLTLTVKLQLYILDDCVKRFRLEKHLERGKGAPVLTASQRGCMFPCSL